MPKRFFKKIVPAPEKLRQQKSLAFLGSKIYDADLWHLNRRSVAKAFLNGIFWAFIPMPFQMVAAAFVAIPLKANIPLSIGLVWITNPFTMPFVFYLNYIVGTFLVGNKPHHEFILSVEWIWEKIETLWLPLYVGSVVLGIIFALIG